MKWPRMRLSSVYCSVQSRAHGQSALTSIKGRPLLAALWRWAERELKAARGGASSGRPGRFSARGGSAPWKQGPGTAQGPRTRLTDATSQLGASQEERVRVQGPQAFESLTGAGPSGPRALRSRLGRRTATQPLRAEHGAEVFWGWGPGCELGGLESHPDMPTL